MQIAKHTILLLVLLFFQMGLIAQVAIDFNDLIESIDNRNRERIVLQYTSKCDETFGDSYSDSNYMELAKVSHYMSQQGYADIVCSNFEKQAKKPALMSKLSPGIFSHFLNEWGYACYYNSQLVKADSIFRQNLEFSESNPDVSPLHVAFAYNFLGLIHRKGDSPEKAISFFEQAKTIRINEYGPDAPQVGSIYNNIGLTYKTIGNFDEALVNFKKAIEIKLLAGSKTVYLNYINMGEMLSQMGNYALAIQYFNSAEEILEGLDIPIKQADVYLNKGGALVMLNANREAYKYLQMALHSYTSYYGEENVKVGHSYHNLAAVYDALEENQLVEQSFNKALNIFLMFYSDEKESVATLYNNYGLYQQRQENYNVSLEYLRQAANIYFEEKETLNDKYLNTLSNIAVTYQLKGEPDSAVFYLHETVDELDDHFEGKHPLLAFSYNKLGEIYFDKNDLDRAYGFVNDAVASNLVRVNNIFRQKEECLDRSYLFESYLLLGKIHSQNDKSKSGAEKEELKYFQLADSVLSVQRNLMFNKEDKIELAKNSKKLAELVLEALVKEERNLSDDQFELAYNYIEKSKNLVLLQSISENQGKNYAGIPDSVLVLEKDILWWINRLSHRIKVESDSLRKIGLEENLFEYKRDYEILVAELEKKYPDYYNIKYKEDIPSLGEIRSELDSETAILSYFLTDRSLYRFFVSKDKVDIKLLENKELGDHLIGMRKGIVLKLDEIYKDKAYSLYELLIPGDLPSTIYNLVIVPDGGLSVLPFEALFTERIKREIPVAEWPFLVTKFEVCYAPSFSLWMKFRQEQDINEFEKSLLALAPVFDSDEPGFRGENSGMLDFTISSNTNKINQLGLSPLLQSKVEVQHIHDLFEKHSFNTKLFVDIDAYESNFTSQDLSEYQYIHIATHGFVDRKKPELSGLYFSPVEQDGYDNILYTGEIYNIKLNASLVTLSACETALGKVAEGEGMLGFSRAFLYAGAKNLVVSLWKVNDASTAALMTGFYNNFLEKDMHYSGALAKAKLDLIRSDEYSHPYYWAPFVLIGQ